MYLRLHSERFRPYETTFVLKMVRARGMGACPLNNNSNENFIGMFYFIYIHYNIIYFIHD